MKRLYSMVFAFLAVSGVTRPLVAATCPERMSFRVPFSFAGRSGLSDLVLEIPMTRLDVAWQQLDTKTAAGDAGRAFKELLAAVYGDNAARVADLVAPAIMQRFGTADKVIGEFKASLKGAGAVSIV